MSALHSLTEATHLLPLAASGGIIELLGQKLNDVKDLALIAAGVAVLVYGIMRAVKASFALPALVILGFSMGFFGYIIYNATDLRAFFENEIENTGSNVSTTTTTP